jgi:hypothetical protein
MIWEYKTALNEIRSTALDIDSQKGFNIIETDIFLNEMGKEQWELVDVNPILINGYTTQLAYFFKRPILFIPSNLPDIGYDIDNNGITGSQR